MTAFDDFGDVVCGGCGFRFTATGLERHQRAKRCYPPIVSPWAAWRDLVTATQRRFANPTRHSRYREETARASFVEALERCP